MPSTKQLLARAVQLQQAGALAEAETLYRQIVTSEPRQAEAWNLLGILVHQTGRIAAALECFERARDAAPSNADYRSNRGAILQSVGRYAEAETEFREVLRLKPNHVDGYNNLGATLQEMGRSAEAETCFRRALNLRPTFAEAHYNLGNSLRSLNRPVEAEECCRRALKLRPDYAEAHNNLGTSLQDQEKYADAAACYRRAIELRPLYADAYNNLGNALSRLGRFEESLPYFHRAIELKPNDAEAHYNLGNAFMDLGRMSEAETALRRSIELKPDGPENHTKLSHLLLLRGDFARGWAEYEWRWKIKNFKFPTYPRPTWDGSPLAGSTILLHAEQGLGDTLNFVRYAPLVKERGGRVLLHCPKQLVDLLGTCRGIDQIVPDGTALPAFDLTASLLSLPRLFGTTLATIPTSVPYLTADPALVERWRTRLTTVLGFKVGIVWQGATTYNKDAQRSVPLHQFEPLARIPGVRLLSLQVGAGTEQLAKQPEILDLGHEFDAASFSDAAAVVKNLDLVIAVDTALVHLAGALGAPVWVALPFTPDWRWLLGRDDSPWYPSVRLFRQTRPGEWNDVFARIAQSLCEQCALSY